MSRFGRTLTDRPYGKKTAGVILREYVPPLALDFAGVISLGSSFGDEIVMAIAAEQEGPIRIANANGAVRACLENVATDAGVSLVFLDD